MTWAVTAATVANIGGSLLGGASARKQAEAKRRALAEAKGETTKAFETSKGYYNPFFETGLGANKLLAARLGLGQDTSAPGFGDFTRNFSMADYQADPGYAFRLKEGLKAAEGSAAARGGLLSGATTRGVQRRAQDLASQEYGNAYDRYRQQKQDLYNILAAQQGVGTQAGGNLANLTTNYGANMANYAMGQGAIDAAKIGAKYGMYGDILKSGANFAGNVAGSGGFGNFFGGGGGSTYGANSMQSQLGYQNARIDPNSNQLRIDF
jgi:hypothetical protein